jgi:hypothetical protein
MQREYATAPLVVVVAVADVATLATPGEPPLPQPVASSDKAAMATTEMGMNGCRQRTGRTLESRLLDRIARKRRLSDAAPR